MVDVAYVPPIQYDKKLETPPTDVIYRNRFFRYLSFTSATATPLIDETFLGQTVYIETIYVVLTNVNQVLYLRAKEEVMWMISLAIQSLDQFFVFPTPLRFSENIALEHSSPAGTAACQIILTGYTITNPSPY